MASTINVVVSIINTYQIDAVHVTLFSKEAVGLFSSTSNEIYAIFSSLVTLEKHHFNLLQNFLTFLVEPVKLLKPSYNAAFYSHLNLIANSRATIVSKLNELTPASKALDLKAICQLALTGYQYQLTILELLQAKNT